MDPLITTPSAAASTWKTGSAASLTIGCKTYLLERWKLRKATPLAMVLKRRPISIDAERYRQITKENASQW